MNNRPGFPNQSFPAQGSFPANSQPVVYQPAPVGYYPQPGYTSSTGFQTTGFSNGYGHHGFFGNHCHGSHFNHHHSPFDHHHDHFHHGHGCK